MPTRARRRPEVLAPAGNLQGLKTAIDYGADAVYCGGKAFGMRSAPRNLSLDDFREGAAYAHARGARVYVTLNILPRNNEVSQIERYIAELAETGIDALIVTDMGIMMMAKRIAPQLELHISTQAGVTNYGAANALAELGASRVVLAREMDLQAVRDIRANIPDSLDIETFVHGSMCMAFSGRCLISNYFTGRDGNHGECAQPCRWRYSLVEEKRPGQTFPVEETKNGTYLFNSQDMNMLEHIDDLIDSGATSLKIEGRSKSAYYVAAMTNAYKTAVNAYMVQRGFEDEQGNVLRPFHDRVIRPGQEIIDDDFSSATQSAGRDSIMAHADQAFGGMPNPMSVEQIHEAETIDGEMDLTMVKQAQNPIEDTEAQGAKKAQAQATKQANAKMKAPDLNSNRSARRQLDVSDVPESDFVHAAVKPAPKVVLPDWLHEEPYKVAHRDYSTGFYYPEQKVKQNNDRSSYFRDWLVVGEVLGWEDGRVTLKSRNKIEAGQEIEFLLPGQAPLVYTAPEGGFLNEAGEPVEAINNPAHVFSMPLPTPVPVNVAIRSRTKKPTLKA
ncbi:collagenase [Bifidobacterium dolichotidis]|uniref:Collagenase n=1 Tax=Bifidobacterium dolichotidis TaxID=2306976 RepID=A0A430FQF4_9BIFI|nr:U32 family peptidase [Bifidobacterium dolichotidis]RSX55034.1 collagenase [Bifidobacterium dolichotidis]